MTILTVSRAIINLGDIELDVFRLEDGTYRLSAERTAAVVNKPRNSTLRFRQGTSPEALPFKGSTGYTMKVEGENTRITGISIDLAIAYWGKEAQAGNSMAIALLLACAKEALDRRADAAFGQEKTEAERNAEFTAFLNQWRDTREFARLAHCAFISGYEKKGHPGSRAHDLLTTLIFGDTAAAARLKQLVDDDADPQIGLNHQEDIANMKKLADAKFKYIGYRKGTWQEQIERACAAVM